MIITKVTSLDEYGYTLFSDNLGLSLSDIHPSTDEILLPCASRLLITITLLTKLRPKIKQK